jgi:ADP-ribose pyrophosphatase YjhB (NUDIX family)
VTLKDRALSAAQSLWDLLPQTARRQILFATNDHFLVGVVGIVADDDHRILLLEHRFRTPWRWGLPGGFIDRGEVLTEGLRRELSEEIGLDADVDSEIFDTEVRTERGYVSMTLTARAKDAPARIAPTQNAEIVGGGFYALDELPDGTYPYHLDLIRRYFATLDASGSRR